jgi:hypothetical protein
MQRWWGTGLRCDRSSIGLGRARPGSGAGGPRPRRAPAEGAGAAGRAAGRPLRPPGPRRAGGGGRGAAHADQLRGLRRPGRPRPQLPGRRPPWCTASPSPPWGCPSGEVRYDAKRHAHTAQGLAVSTIWGDLLWWWSRRSAVSPTRGVAPLARGCCFGSGMLPGRWRPQLPGPLAPPGPDIKQHHGHSHCRRVPSGQLACLSGPAQMLSKLAGFKGNNQQPATRPSRTWYRPRSTSGAGRLRPRPPHR